MNYTKCYLSYIVLLNKCMLHKCNPKTVDSSIYIKTRFYQQKEANYLIYGVRECCVSDLCMSILCPIKNIFQDFI